MEIIKYANPSNLDVEVIENTKINPLISKVKVKVFYLGHNRNDSLITREKGIEIAKTLPGSPIVGAYDTTTEDFKGHELFMGIEDGKFVEVDLTRPYGFVPTDAEISFQNFLDHDGVVREYVVVDAYIWSGQYPEAERILSLGNNQSMKLDVKDAAWAYDNDLGRDIFVINEAIIENLCILGLDHEPCFEGAAITKEETKIDTKQELLSKANQAVQSVTHQAITLFELGGMENMDIKDVVLEEDVIETEETFENDADNIQTDETSLENQVVIESEEDATELFEDGGVDSNADAILDQIEAEQEKCEEAQAEEEVDEDSLAEAIQEINREIDALAEVLNVENNYEAVFEAINTITNENATLRDAVNTYERVEKLDFIKSFSLLDDVAKADIINNVDKYNLAEIETQLAIAYTKQAMSETREEVEIDITETYSDDVATFSLTDDQDIRDNNNSWQSVVRSNKEKDL